jgi:NlpC/P60 family putative phage cell wall peptidase
MTPHAQVIEIARSWIGTPFHHQASLKAVGCDCLGLLRGIWRELYGNEPVVPAYYIGWARETSDEWLLAALRDHFITLDDEALDAGQVLLFRWRANWAASHVAITTSSQMMIHAQYGCGTCEVPLHISWRKRLIARFAFPPF